jgi:hypothetical protein
LLLSSPSSAPSKWGSSEKYAASPYWARQIIKIGSVFMRFYGNVGYGEPVKKAPGVTKIEYTTKAYYGDVLKDTSRWERAEGLNDNLNIANRISIVADGYAYEKFYAIVWVEWMGKKWKVQSAEVQRPRIILSIGGLWNENST